MELHYSENDEGRVTTITTPPWKTAQEHVFFSNGTVFQVSNHLLISWKYLGRKTMFLDILGMFYFCWFPKKEIVLTKITHVQGQRIQRIQRIREKCQNTGSVEDMSVISLFKTNQPYDALTNQEMLHLQFLTLNQNLIYIHAPNPRNRRSATFLVLDIIDGYELVVDSKILIGVELVELGDG